MAGLDEAAFSAFYASQARGLWAYVYRTTGNAADADEVVQEAFMRILRAGPDTDDVEQQRRFLYRVASNLMVDRWRTRKHEADEPHAEPSVAPRTPDDDVAKTFAALSRRERALLWLAYVEGESHDAIATSLGVGKGSIKVMLFRAKRRLRDLLTARGLTRI